MAIIHIQPTDVLKIRFADEAGRELDGEFEIHFDTSEHPLAVVIKETAGLEGSITGAASAIIYEDRFNGIATDLEEEMVEGDS